MNVTIETNVPVPVAATYAKYASYPYKQLKVRESFVYRANRHGADINTLRQAMSHYGRRTKKKFMTRKLSAATWRVWRMK